MVSTEQELQALNEERQRSAAKVRSLLEQLEQAEKEFVAIMEKLRSFRDPSSSVRAPRSAPPAKAPSFAASATPRA